MSYNDQDYQQFAKAIVEDFVLRQVPLEDNVVKVAADHGMNAYETRRLLEATNMDAHLTLFEKMADHKYVEFDVVDPQRVCDRLFASPEPAACPPEDPITKVASLNLELPDERWEKLSSATAEKLAAQAFPLPTEEPADPYAGEKFAHAVSLACRVSEELEMRARAAHMAYTDKVATLAGAFTYVSAMPFEEFEKDAHALVGTEVAHIVLGKMRELNPGLPPAAHHKQASAAPRYVVERKEHALLREVVAAHAEALDLAHGWAWYQQQAEPFLT